MGCDKACLTIGGQTLINRSVGLLHDLGLPVAVSARQDQIFDLPGCDRVNDTDPGLGPVGGLKSVMEVLITMAIRVDRYRS